MNSFIVVLSCLAAVTLANPTSDVIVEFSTTGRATCRNASCRRINPLADCVSTCPPRVNTPNCAQPNCNLSANSVWLHPHWDPNWYWQCIENVWGTYDPVAMPCACETLFQSRANRCVHVEDWVREDHCPTQNFPPIVSRDFCDGNSCPDCGGDTGPGPEIPGITEPPATTPGPDVCQCPCIPCIWWPCQPCATNCACNQPQVQPPRVQLPPQSNWPNPPQNNWQNPPQDNWRNPPQDNWRNPPQDNWRNPPQDNWRNPPQDNWRNPPQDNWRNPPQNNWQNLPQDNWQNWPENNWQQPPQNWQRLHKEEGDEEVVAELKEE